MANALNKVNSGGIEDGSIVNSDIKSDAAIAGSKLADNAVGLAQMASGTDGQIITYDASGDPIAVGPGTDGQVLTSTGAGSPPAFEDLPTSGATLSGSTDDTVVTVTGANAMQGEATLKFTSNYLQLNHANGGISWGTGTPGSFGTSPSIGIAEQAGYHSSGSAVNDLVIGAKHQKAVIIGTTSNASGGLTTRFSVENGGDVQVKTGNLVIGTAGKGIDFSAQTNTSVSGTYANADENLNHYEYGTWTAAFASGGSNTNSNCDYIRIGKFVMISGNIVCDDITTNSAVSVTGIPFSCISRDFTGSLRGYGIGNPTIATNTYANNSTVGSSDSIEFGAAAPQGQGWEMIYHNDFNNTNNSIRFTITYITDS